MVMSPANCVARILTLLSSVLRPRSTHTAGIAAEKYSHVKYFPNRAAYDDYYDIAVDIGEVGVESFATRIQEMLVDYLRDKHGDKVADWCRDFWTGERGRMCLAHSRYAG